VPAKQGIGAAAYVAHVYDAEGVNPLRTDFGFLAFIEVFTLFPLFPLFFDSAEGLFDCKYPLLMCFFANRITWVHNSTIVLFMQIFSLRKNALMLVLK